MLSVQHLTAIGWVISAVAGKDPFGTCDNPFKVLKYTWVSTDAFRDCAMMEEIFLDVVDEDSLFPVGMAFPQGMCSYSCKMALPETCFKMHAPQTPYDEGLLAVETLEKKVSSKWKHAMSGVDDAVSYDAFFDTNMAFWVNSLDDYLARWQVSSADLEYFGIEWQWTPAINADIADEQTVYSVLVHSPSSAATFEFVSFEKPKLYSLVSWTTSKLPRATFQGQSERYPWEREDAASIVPIRISHAVADVDASRDFYTTVLKAEELYSSTVEMDGEAAKTVFMGLLDSHIEIQFVQRAADATYGTFTIPLYQDLVTETHETIMESPYCGQDRWMDNLYGWTTVDTPEFMDGVYDALNERGSVYKFTAPDPDGRSSRLGLGVDPMYTKYGLWMVEPGGQTIQMHGYLSKTGLEDWARWSDPGWCRQWTCDHGLDVKTCDPSKAYVDDEDYGDVQPAETLFAKLFDVNRNVDGSQIVLGAVFVLMVLGALYFGVSKFGRKKSAWLSHEEDEEPLLSKSSA